MRGLARALVVVAAAVTGCATVQVRSVGTNTGQPAYDLVGPSLQSLADEAGKLCPQGHAVMRQWQRSNRPVGQGDGTASGTAATVALSYDLQPDQAQISIVCRG
jgi:hypothetical protein